MGEYADRKSDNVEVKIGTCESMYYLRYQDRDKVKYSFGDYEYFWRLPFPDEDNTLPGDYKEYNRGFRLVKKIEDSRGERFSCWEDFNPGNTTENPGTLQIKHDCGLLVNVKCFHGVKLPDQSEHFKPFWNGKSHFFELAFLKNTKDGVLPVVRCRVCGNMWRCDWDEILPYISNPEMKKRLEVYA